MREPVQAKLEVGAADDPFEREADAVAEAVIRRLAARPQGGDGADDDGPRPIRRVQRAASHGPSGREPVGLAGGPVPAAIEAQIRNARGGGRPLERATAIEMGAAMGADFGAVRVHAGPLAERLNRSLNARAFTSGSDIFFRDGAPNPDTDAGRRLVAHELAHTLQQGAIPTSNEPVRRSRAPGVQRLAVDPQVQYHWDDEGEIDFRDSYPVLGREVVPLDIKKDGRDGKTFRKVRLLKTKRKKERLGWIDESVLEKTILHGAGDVGFEHAGTPGTGAVDVPLFRFDGTHVRDDEKPRLFLQPHHDVKVLRGYSERGKKKPKKKAAAMYVEVYKSARVRGWVDAEIPRQWALDYAKTGVPITLSELVPYFDLDPAGEKIVPKVRSFFQPGFKSWIRPTAEKEDPSGEKYVEVQMPGSHRSRWILLRDRKRADMSKKVGDVMAGAEQTAAFTTAMGASRFNVGGAPVADLATLAKQNLFDPQVFAKYTKTKGHKRGKALQAIDGYLPQYAPLAAKTTRAAKKQQLTLLYQMQFAAQRWLLDHTAQSGSSEVIDPNRKKRYVGMTAFLTKVDDTLVSTQRALAKQAGGSALATEITAALDTAAADPTHKKLKEKYEGDPTSLLTKLGFLIDAAVPSPGDSSEIEVDFRWPCEPTGIAFVGGVIKLSAANDSPPGAAAGGQDSDNVVARMEIRFQVGAQFLDLAKLKADFGGYIETSAHSGGDCMTAMSYAVYRKFRESSVVPESMTNYLWGRGRKGDFGRFKAEQWATDVEDKILGDDGAYAETGLIGSVSGSIGHKFSESVSAEFEAGVTFSRGTKYDKESIDKARARPGAQAKSKRGRRTQALVVEFGATVGPFAGGATLILHWQTEDDLGAASGSNPLILDSVEIEFSAGANVPVAGADEDEMAQRIVGWATEGVKTISQKARAAAAAKETDANRALSAQQKSTRKKAKGVGETFRSLFDGLDQLQNSGTVTDALNPDPSDTPWLDTIEGADPNVSTLESQHAENMFTGKDALFSGDTSLGGPATGDHFKQAWSKRSMESTVGLSMSIGIGFERNSASKLGLSEVEITFSLVKERALSVPLFLDITQSSSSRLIAFNKAKDDQGSWQKWDVK